MQPRRPLFPAFCALQFLFCGTIESRTVSPELHVQHTTAAPPLPSRAAGGGYGHRSVPADAVRKVRGRLEEAVQEEERPYETAGTYEYMVRPTAGKGSRTRVPETERRPPGADDVELIHDRYYGEGRNGDRYYRGYGAPAAGSDRYRGYGRGGPRYVDPEPVEKPRRYVGGGPTPVEKPRTAAAAAAKPGGKDARREQVDVVVDEPGERRVVKKNEYSKKREFFDEEHVKDPAERPAEPAASSSRSQKERARSGGRADPRRKKRKRRAKKVKKHKNRRPVGGNNFGGSGSGSDNYAAAVASAGYGQILAVR